MFFLLSKCKKCKTEDIDSIRWRRSGVFIDNFEHILRLFLGFLLLTLNMYLSAGKYKKVILELFYVRFELELKSNLSAIHLLGLKFLLTGIYRKVL